MSKVYKVPQGKGTAVSGTLIGIGMASLLFLAIPLTQLFTEYEKAPEEINSIDVAPPAPPPPIEEPPPPPEPEPEEPPPELDTPPPPISLEALEMSLNPGTGSSLAGDFTMPGFNANQKSLGSLDIFDIGDVDGKPQAQKQAPPRYPSAARRAGKEGFVVAEFIIDTNGATTDIKIQQSSDPVFNQPTIEAIRRWMFTPGKKGNRLVKTRTRVKLPFQIN